MKSHSAWPSKTHHQKATRQGVYGAKKDIQPMPKCEYVAARFNLPVAQANVLRDKYPDRSLNMAIKAYLQDTPALIQEAHNRLTIFRDAIIHADMIVPLWVGDLIEKLSEYVPDGN